MFKYPIAARQWWPQKKTSFQNYIIYEDYFQSSIPKNANNNNESKSITKIQIIDDYNQKKEK